MQEMTKGFLESTFKTPNEGITSLIRLQRLGASKQFWRLTKTFYVLVWEAVGTLTS